MKKTMNMTELFDAMPEYAFTTYYDGTIIKVMKGVMGYIPAPLVPNPELANEKLGVHPKMAEAMKMGTMFGFEVPGVEELVKEAMADTEEA